MVQVVDITCPACGQKRSYLSAWRHIGRVLICVCPECYERELSSDELLRVGFHHGVQFAKGQIREELNREIEL